jgi:hypothetical protein
MAFKAIDPKKVKFSKIESGGRFVKWEKKGQTVLGYLKMSEIRKGQFGKQKVFHIQVDDKKTVMVSGKLIESALEDVKKGSIVKIVFTGKQKAKKGKNQFNTFDIFVEE